MPRPIQPPDPTPEEIAERAAIVRAENLARKRKEGAKYKTSAMYEYDDKRDGQPARVCRIRIAKNGDRM